jgi:hypothetical protein
MDDNELWNSERIWMRRSQIKVNVGKTFEFNTEKSKLKEIAANQ